MRWVMTRSRGTRFPAPHQAKRRTSGSAAAMVGSGVGAGFAQEDASGGCDQFGYPVLGVDQGLAPLFGVDEGFWCSGCDGGGLGGGVGDVGDESLGSGGVDQGGYEADVFGYGGEVVWGEGEDREAGLEDGCEGLHAIGDAGDDEVGFGGESVSRLPGASKDQLSWRTGRLRASSSGRDSRQYFVIAQRVSRRPRDWRVMVMEGWREAMRMRLMYETYNCRY